MTQNPINPIQFTWVELLTYLSWVGFENKKIYYKIAKILNEL